VRATEITNAISLESKDRQHFWKIHLQVQWDMSCIYSIQKKTKMHQIIIISASAPQIGGGEGKREDVPYVHRLYPLQNSLKFANFHERKIR